VAGRRVPKPAGRVFCCPYCGQGGHRDLVAAVNIAARGGGTIPALATGAGITHRRTGAHLPGVHPARRDPRRRPPSRPAARGHLAGTGPPRNVPADRGVARRTRRGVRKTTGQPPANLRTRALSRQNPFTSRWVRTVRLFAVRISRCLPLGTPSEGAPTRIKPPTYRAGTGSFFAANQRRAVTYHALTGRSLLHVHMTVLGCRERHRTLNTQQLHPRQGGVAA
jgi:hypothetical protein